MTRSWRWSVATSEGVRAWYSGRWLTAILGLLMILGLGVPATADAVTVSRLVADEQTWVAAGGRVLVVTDEAGGVPRAACAGLVDVVGVEAAAAVSRQPHTAALATAPGAAVPVVTATAGVSDLLGLPALGSQAVLPPSLATELRLDVGDRLTLLPAPWSVSGEFSGEGGPTAATDPLDQPPSGPITVAAVADLGLLGEASSHCETRCPLCCQSPGRNRWCRTDWHRADSSATTPRSTTRARCAWCPGPPGRRWGSCGC